MDDREFKFSSNCYRTIARILPGNATSPIHRLANQPNNINLGLTILNNRSTINRLTA
jgi:hypothetical protein